MCARSCGQIDRPPDKTGAERRFASRSACPEIGEESVPRIALPQGVSVHCAVDDFLWPWDHSTPVLMMHGFARNAIFWNRWVPAIAETHRVYRPDLLGCGLSDQPPAGYRYTPDTIGGQILAVLDALSLPRVHWVGESSGGIIGLLLAAAHPDRIASLVLCNTPSRIPDQIKRTYALDRASASDAMRAYGVGEWCRQTLGYRLDKERAGADLCDWVVREMDRTPPDIAAAMRDCFEGVDTLPLLPRVNARCYCSAATKARSPRHSSRRSRTPCRTGGSSCLLATATASIWPSRSAAPAPPWNSGGL
jgi:pimeloyl-ACP methyl ester carboxylesterase